MMFTGLIHRKQRIYISLIDVEIVGFSCSDSSLDGLVASKSHACYLLGGAS